MADERDTKNKDKKDKKKDKRFRQKKKKRMNALEGRGQGNLGTSNSSTRQGEAHNNRRVASTHDLLCTQSNAQFNDQFKLSCR